MTFRTTLPFLFAFASLGALACTANTGSTPPDPTPDPTSPAPSPSPPSTTPPSTTPPANPGVPLTKSSAARDAINAAALGPAVASNNAFAFQLYDQVVAPGVASGGNVLLSPLSASLALTMAYAGAQGPTATEMATALDLPSAGASATFDGQNALTQTLDGRAAAALAASQTAAKESGAPAPSASDYAFEVVSSVWGEKTYTWVPSFLDVMAKSYGTGIYLEDFLGGSAGAVTAINDWVSASTDDKINNLLSPSSIDASTRIVLVNAVHLKMPWSTPFNTDATASGPFTRADGSTVTASFMRGTFQQPTVSYAETDQAQTVSIPLAGGQLSVVVALPKKDLPTLVASLTPATWASMTSVPNGGQGGPGVILSLPKFTYGTQTFSLKAPLEALGMKSAFGSGADFTGLYAGGGVTISDVLQKATIALSETGVEASAATAVPADAAASTTNVTVSLDHPFLFSIVDASGAILFLGQIGDPTATGSL